MQSVLILAKAKQTIRWLATSGHFLDLLGMVKVGHWRGYSGAMKHCGLVWTLVWTFGFWDAGYD